MRTDSPRLAGEAIGEMRSWLAKELGAEYVPEEPRQFKGKRGAQEAHEAIRPTVGRAHAGIGARASQR
jgi:DNA topoisomerase-1